MAYKLNKEKQIVYISSVDMTCENIAPVASLPLSMCMCMYVYVSVCLYVCMCVVIIILHIRYNYLIRFTWYFCV